MDPYTKVTKNTPRPKMASDGGSTAYYDLPEGATTLNDLIEFKQMDFARGNIFKAAYRLDEKEGADVEYDLNKIIYFAERKLAQLASVKKQKETEAFRAVCEHKWLYTGCGVYGCSKCGETMDREEVFP